MIDQPTVNGQLLEIIRGINQLAAKQDEQLALLERLQDQIKQLNQRVDDLASVAT